MRLVLCFATKNILILMILCAQNIYDEQIDDSPAEGYVLYRGENHTYAGKNGNVLHLYDFTIISDDPNTELTASLMSA